MTAQNPLNTTRDDIIRVAVHLFAEKGYTQTGMDEIAREVGITKPAIYYYFQSKEKLLAAILEFVDQLHNRTIGGLAEKNLGLHDLVEEMIREAIRMMRDWPDWFRMLFRVFSAAAELPGFVDLKRHHLDDHAKFRALLEPSLRGVRLRPGISLDDLTDHFVNLIVGLTTHWTCLDEVPDAEETPRRLRDVFLYGVVEK